MITSIAQFFFSLETLAFLTVILMHLVRKNSSTVFLYIIQSLLILFFFYPSFAEASPLLIISLIAMFAVKVIIAPYFFISWIKKHGIRFSNSTYLNVPLTLLVITILTGLCFSYLSHSFVSLDLHNSGALPLAFAMLLSSIFLIINRKGALSQILGVLSLENSIVSFASLAGLEQSPALQLGILFDILVWIIIAVVFLSMIFTTFGSLNVTAMQHLKEE